MSSSKTSSPPVWLDPTHPTLEGNEAKLAVSNLIVEVKSDQTYTKVIRSQTDIPVAQQQCGLISWMLFEEPKKLKSGKPVYGFMKLRGNWSDADMAKNRAADIIRTQDSKNKINLIPIGSWVPITDDDSVSRETINVNTDDDPSGLSGMKENAAKELEKEQDRIKREIRERAEEVKNSKDYNDDQDHIDFYTMKRVTWMRLAEERNRLTKQIESVEQKINTTRKVCYGLEQKHPEYKQDWIDNYNKERRKSRIPDYLPGKAEEEEYNKYNHPTGGREVASTGTSASASSDNQ
jgi:hypothetical protein